MAPGPYYATPSWDQQLPAASRFIVLSNWNAEAVLDRETGMVWQRQPAVREEENASAQVFCRLADRLRYWCVRAPGGRADIVDAN